MKTRKLFITAICIFAIAVGVMGLASSSAFAEYPERAITCIVPFGAGGGFDGLVRALAPRLEKELGVPIPIKNEPGSGGTRGSITIYKSKPDGYTIGMPHFGALQVNQVLLDRDSGIDYKKFEVIMQIAQSKDFIYVNKNSNFKSLDDFKKANRVIKFGTTGIGALSWVAGNAVGSIVGYDVTFVTGYKSLGEAALGVARGDVDAAIGSYSHFQGVIDDIRPLVCLSAERSQNLPDVPTIQEARYGQLKNLGTPRIIGAPPGTPEEHLDLIRKALQKIINGDEFKKWAVEAGYSLNPLNPNQVWEALDKNEEIYKSMKPKLQTNK